MPTVEERLAALETKLAALTDTTPTTYYTHQYSGEEIDESVGVTQDTVPTLVRPNLLDNWYFGNPVDQKKGMLQLAGTMLYSDAACTQALFPSTKTTSIIKVSDIAAHPSDDSTVYVKLADCVRGYTGNGYSVDRWKMQLDIGIILLEADGIILDATANALTLVQFFESDLLRELAGNTLTWSVMYTILEQSGAPGGLGYTIPGNYYAQAIMSGDVGKLCVASGSISAPTNLEIPAQMYIPKGCKIKLVAAKLELGPTQTLAHKEGERWVLNEIPKYSRELLDCRMYNVKFGYADKYCILGSGVARDDTFVSITVPVPAELRTYPVVILTGVIIIRHSDVVNQACTTLVLDAIGVSSILLKIKASGLTPGDAYEAFLAPGNYLDVSCDL